MPGRGSNPGAVRRWQHRVPSNHWAISLDCAHHFQDGKSALDIARDRKDKDPQSSKCYSMLLQHCATLRLVQAVLGEDTEQLKDVLQQRDPNLNVNARYKVRYSRGNRQLYIITT